MTVAVGPRLSEQSRQQLIALLHVQQACVRQQTVADYVNEYDCRFSSKPH
jgi:hypothetical protein